MKKLILLLLGIILISTLSLGVFTLVSQDVEAAPCDKCHFVWDNVDKVMWCIGSPTQCCCSMIPPPK